MKLYNILLMKLNHFGFELEKKRLLNKIFAVEKNSENVEKCFVGLCNVSAGSLGYRSLNNQKQFCGQHQQRIEDAR